jgi:hypothetical protein
MQRYVFGEGRPRASNNVTLDREEMAVLAP